MTTTKEKLVFELRMLSHRLDNVLTTSDHVLGLLDADNRRLLGVLLDLRDGARLAKQIGNETLTALQRGDDTPLFQEGGEKDERR